MTLERLDGPAARAAGGSVTSGAGDHGNLGAAAVWAGRTFARVGLARGLSRSQAGGDNRAASGSILVVDGSGRWSAGAGEPAVTVDVHDQRAYALVAGRGSVGLGTSYVEGLWDCDDLTALVRLLFRGTSRLRVALDSGGRAASLALSPIRALLPPSLRQDRRNVQAHYDLPGGLFELMLDETMAYSCAVFDRPGMTLAEAQRAKFDRLCQKLRLAPEDHLLEIGTGWGGLAMYVADRYGCRVTTTTISDAQREVASKRIADACLADRITVLGMDYRELTGTYDKLVSVEMIEAVDWRRHGAFFATCSRLLRRDGLMALQAITIADQSYERAKHHDDFVRRMIFPGGCIPSLEAISRSVRKATDMAVIDVEDIGRHYAETLRRWRQNFRANASKLSTVGVDGAFRRLWELYLSYCEAAFLEGHISDVQVVLAKPGWRKDLAVRTA